MFRCQDEVSDVEDIESHEKAFKLMLLDEIQTRSLYQSKHQDLSKKTFIEILRIPVQGYNKKLIDKIISRFYKLIQMGKDAIDRRNITTKLNKMCNSYAAGGEFTLIVLDEDAYLYDDTRKIKYIFTK
ncbi:MAG: hypothetical protein QM500_13515 [Methylococcales bacterium]